MINIIELNLEYNYQNKNVPILIIFQKETFMRNKTDETGKNE